MILREKNTLMVKKKNGYTYIHLFDNANQKNKLVLKEIKIISEQSSKARLRDFVHTSTSKLNGPKKKLL